MKIKLTCGYCKNDDLEFDIKSQELICSCCGEPITDENYELKEIKED